MIPIHAIWGYQTLVKFPGKTLDGWFLTQMEIMEILREISWRSFLFKRQM